MYQICRWLNRRLLGFSKIKCDATCERKAVRGESGVISLIPKLCGNFALGAKLLLGLTPGATCKQHNLYLCSVSIVLMRGVSCLHWCNFWPLLSVTVLLSSAELTSALLMHTHDLSTGTHSSWHADYWQPLARCLTDLYIMADTDRAVTLQPCLLTGLSRLTSLAFELTLTEVDDLQYDDLPQLELPELRELSIAKHR